MSDILWSKNTPGVFWGMPREADAIECKCGGYAGRVDSTVEECAEYGCGRDAPGCECCARAFVCKFCGARYVGMADAPEMR